METNLLLRTYVRGTADLPYPPDGITGWGGGGEGGADFFLQGQKSEAHVSSVGKIVATVMNAHKYWYGNFDKDFHDDLCFTMVLPDAIGKPPSALFPFFAKQNSGTTPSIK